MAELSRIAQSIFLGNGEVWNFLNYARGLSIGDIGGLLRYTGAIGAFGNAVNSNLRQGSGVGQRMPASELTYEKSYHILRGAGDSGSRIHETGQAATTTLIGDVYAAERPDASERRFVTQDDFTALGRYARNKAMQLNRGGMMSNSAMTVSGLTAIGVGDDVTPAMTTIIDDTLATELDNGTILGYTDKILSTSTGDRRFGQVPKGATRRVFSPIAPNGGPDSGTSMYSPRRPYGYARETNRQLSAGEDAGGLIDEFFNPTNAADGNSYIPGGTSDIKGLTEYAYDGTGTRVYTYYKELEDRIAGKELGNNTADSMKVTASTAGDTYENGEQSYLLHRTARMFANGIIGSLVNRFHGDVKDSDFLSSYSSLYGISRGRNLLKESFSTDGNGYTNPYCRVWTASHQYARLRDRIRPFISDSGFMKLSDVQAKYGSLRPNGSTESLDKYSVLQPNGFVRITPTERSTSGTIKNYMFSIENLAWKDILRDTETDAVSEEQRGPNGGRIMWFPPYGLNFTENVNVNWVSNSFIGRGEDIHTYVSTVRSGTLDFIIICDHPSVVDKWAAGKSGYDSRNENRLLRFFAGCDDLNDGIPEVKEAEEEPQDETEPSTDPEPVFQTRKICYVVFFPNNFSGRDYTTNPESMEEAINVIKAYNEGQDFETNFSDEAYEDQILQKWNRHAKGIVAKDYEDEIRINLLNGDPDIEIHFSSDLDSIAENFKGGTVYGMSVGTYEIKKVSARGYASSHGYRNDNIMLANSRADFISQWARLCCDDIIAEDIRPDSPSIINIPDIDGQKDVNSLDARLARAAVLTVEISWQENNQPSSPPVTDDAAATVEGMSMGGGASGKSGTDSDRNERTVTETVGADEYTYDNEYLYFKKLEATSPMVWRAIVEKIRHFDPAFHSVTPEGYNARLTFLHQCTRQGPTRSVSGGRTGEESSDYLKFAGNLSFGRAPYCILRIGDFYNTKICITSMSISYDSGNGLQWDLNPEGTGVQPMFAKVSLTFNFLGGQDLSGPIERLQNAVTANFYANASVYDRHADNGTHYYDAWESGAKARKEKEIKEKNTNS